MLIFKETSHKREAKKGSGDGSPGWGLGDEIPHRSPYREVMKKKKSGSEAIPDGRLTQGWVLFGNDVRNG